LVLFLPIAQLDDVLFSVDEELAVDVRDDGTNCMLVPEYFGEEFPVFFKSAIDLPVKLEEFVRVVGGEGGELHRKDELLDNQVRLGLLGLWNRDDPFGQQGVDVLDL
jgi:hypothetical protein